MTDTTAPAATPALKTFADLDVDSRICAALTAAGIDNPFPIQELTLPLALTGADLIGQARTGTGKTLAFGIPLLQRALKRDGPHPSALVIVPTRELCLQVRDDLAAAAARTDVQVVAVYGGKSIDVQVDALEKGTEVVVGTPGRLLDLLRRGSLILSGVSALVLDEADEMLDLGFLPDVEQLIQATAEQRQTLLFSATMPSAVVALARRYMNKPTFMRADVEEVRIGPDTVQHFFSCHRMDKPAVLARILQSPERGLCVVFSRTKRMADVLVEELRAQGVNAAAIHSDLRQDARERALRSFRTGKTDVLVATEVAARGLDITDVTHVVNYDCPDDEKMYLHRIGRTGRAGAAGIAVTLAVWNELARLEMIKKALGITDPTHEVFSTSPILEELFNLPPHDTARRAQPALRGEEADETPSAADAAARQPATARRTGRRRARGSRRTQASAAAPQAETRVAAAEISEVTEAIGADSAVRAPIDTEPPADAASAGVVRRVRTRRRSGTSRPPAAPPSRPQTSEEEPQPARRSKPSAQEAAPAAADEESPAARRSGRRDGRRSRERNTVRSSDRRPPDRRTAPVDTEAARGSGRPRLARPLVISYLP
ncbi:MAG: DEAD/DEAH box helicase [Nitriliruptorales bacterium]|nr:DEAD/DEAH box helicase [Nitriliruptorales bacterium]